MKSIKSCLYTEYFLYHMLLQLQIIWIAQTEIAIFFSKNIFYKSWVEVVLGFENLYHEQLQITLMSRQEVIETIRGRFHYP